MEELELARCALSWIVFIMQVHDKSADAKIMNLAVTRFDYRNKSYNLPSISRLLTAESIKRDRKRLNFNI